MKTIVQVLLYVVLAVAFVSTAVAKTDYHGLTKEDACKVAQTHLKAGDLIFLAIDNYFFREMVAKMTQSWVSHVGIAFQETNGEWYVMESTIPVSRKTEICAFLKRSEGPRFGIRRFTSLREGDVAKLLAASEKRLGLYYDTGFDFYSEGRQFCSRFVREVFLEAIGVKIGSLQTFQDLKDENPGIDYTFAEFWFFGQIPWERTTVTPKTQWLDTDLETVVESFN